MALLVESWKMASWGGVILSLELQTDSKGESVEIHSVMKRLVCCYRRAEFGGG
jgi:hypothetical protein